MATRKTNRCKAEYLCNCVEWTECRFYRPMPKHWTLICRYTRTHLPRNLCTCRAAIRAIKDGRK